MAKCVENISQIAMKILMMIKFRKVQAIPAALAVIYIKGHKES